MSMPMGSPSPFTSITMSWSPQPTTCCVAPGFRSLLGSNSISESVSGGLSNVTPACPSWSVCASCGEHVEGDGCGPGLFRGAERFAGERLEVLCEAPLRELLQGLAANTLSPLTLSRAKQRPPEEPVGDRPDRTAPIAARVEAGLFRAGGRRQWMAQTGVAGESLRVERVEKIAKP